MRDDSWIIRLATAGDVEMLAEFNCSIALETENKYLDKAVVQSGVSRGLQQGAEVVYLVADDGSGPVGSLMLTREWSDWRDGWLAWIQSVYVTPPFRGQGVFRSLLDHAESLLRADPDVVGMRLYVEADNDRAQSVYARTGFADPRYKVLEKMF